MRITREELVCDICERSVPAGSDYAEQYYHGELPMFQDSEDFTGPPTSRLSFVKRIVDVCPHCIMHITHVKKRIGTSEYRLASFTTAYPNAIKPPSASIYAPSINFNWNSVG